MFKIDNKGTAVPSSQKYKTNIQEVNDDTVSLLHQLKSVEFDYKNNGKHAYGLIAEEVEQQIPTIVLHHPQTNEIESVDYVQLIPLLIKAIQNQQKQLDKYEEILSKL